MAANELSDAPSWANFFQRRIIGMLEYWHENEAVAAIDASVLDQEREAILKVISLGLDFEPAWPTVKALTIAFTPYMERRGHWEVWNTLLQRAIAAAQRGADLAGEITLSAMLARLYQRQSRPEETVRYYRRVIRLARQTNNQFEEARACSNLGFLYIDGGHWWRSKILCCHALTIFEKLESGHGQAHTHNHLGLLYTRQRLWSDAETHLQNACKLWQQMSDNHGLLQGFSNIGVLYLEMERSDQALIFLEKALHQAKVTGESTYLSSIWNNLGIVHRQKKNFQQAEDYTKQAEQSFRQAANRLGLAQVWGNLGLVYLRQTQWSKAELYFIRSLETYRELANREGQITTLTNLVNYEQAKGDSRQAEIYMHDAKQLIEKYYRGERLDYWQAYIKDRTVA